MCQEQLAKKWNEMKNTDAWIVEARLLLKELMATAMKKLWGFFSC